MPHLGYPLTQPPTPQNHPCFLGKPPVSSDFKSRSNWSRVSLAPHDKVRSTTGHYRRFGAHQQAWYWEGRGKPTIPGCQFVRVFEDKDPQPKYSGWFYIEENQCLTK